MAYQNDMKKIVRRGAYLGNKKMILFLFLVFVLIISNGISFAAETGRYEVVSGSGENAYLVDTTTGQVWILTYRSLATGREPVAIPYKFLKISPKNQKEFLVESMEQPAPSDIKGKD